MSLTVFLRTWGIGLGIALLAVALWQTGVLEALLSYSPQTLRSTALAYAAENPVLVYAVYVLVYILSVALSLPIAALLTLVGGALFGTWVGTLLVALSATIGATLIFLVARSALGNVLRRQAQGFYAKAEQEMTENAWFYLFSLRLIPAFPFFIANVLPALFPVTVKQYVITTFLGILPGTAIYVNIGASVSDISDVSELISPRVLMAFGLLAILSLLPIIIKKIRVKSYG